MTSGAGGSPKRSHSSSKSSESSCSLSTAAIFLYMSMRSSLLPIYFVGMLASMIKSTVQLTLLLVTPCSSSTASSSSLQVEVVAHGLHVAVLLGAQHVAGTPDFQVAHGNLEARAELRKLPDGRKPLARRPR